MLGTGDTIMRLSVQTLRLCGPLLLVGLLISCAGPKKPTPPPGPTVVLRDTTATNPTDGAIGGLVWLNSTALLIARDAKNIPPASIFPSATTPGTPAYAKSRDLAKRHLAIARATPGGLVLETLTLTADNNFNREKQPSDIEAICIPTDIPSTSDEAVNSTTNTIRIIATESRRYDPIEGRLFLIELSQRNIGSATSPNFTWDAKVIGIKKLPADPPAATRNKGDLQIEGLACFKQPASADKEQTNSSKPSDEYTLLLGYRGKHEIPTDATNRIGSIAIVQNVDFQDPAMTLPGYNQLQKITVNGVKPTTPCGSIVPASHPDDEWRDISDILVKDNGDIWATSTVDINDGNGPFCSTVHRVPHRISYNTKTMSWELSTSPGVNNPSHIPTYKVEAIVGETRGSTNFILGYDNEKAKEKSGVIAP